MTKTPWRDWLADALVGGAVGLVAAGIVAVNLVIYYGFELGYETSLSEVFEHSATLGLVVVFTLASGPVVGALTAHMRRVKRSQTGRHSH